jgi:L-alanine-DL-glutamate epimerase-like enolase superfamily enzyme
MKITDVKIQIIKREFKMKKGTDLTHGGSSFAAKFADIPVLTIITDDGIEGIAMGFSGKEIVQYLVSIKPFLIGKNPLYREELWQQIWAQSRERLYSPVILGMIDVALWDIAGKAANLPIYQLLGAYRDKIQAYASTPMISDKKVMVDLLLEYQAKGFNAFKLHMNTGSAIKDIELCRAVRDALGDNAIIMHDAIATYDHREALMVGRELEKLNYYWFEEPISSMDTCGLTNLCRDLDISIAFQSFPGNLFSRAQDIIHGATDIVRGDVLYSEGITALKKTAALAEANFMKCEIHGLFNPVMNAANLHVMCSIKNSDFYEYITVDEISEFGVKQGIKIDDKGYAHVPQKPGIGLEIDWDYINRCTIETL